MTRTRQPMLAYERAPRLHRGVDASALPLMHDRSGDGSRSSVVSARRQLSHRISGSASEQRDLPALTDRHRPRLATSPKESSA